MNRSKLSLVLCAYFNKNTKFFEINSSKLAHNEARFRDLTMGHTVVMSLKSWKNCDEDLMFCKGRNKIILTEDKALVDGGNYYSEKPSQGSHYYMTHAQFIVYMCDSEPSSEFYILGCKEIYDIFMNTKYSPGKVYLTEILEPESVITPVEFIKPLRYQYSIEYHTEVFYDKEVNKHYRFIEYSVYVAHNPPADIVYMSLINEVLTFGDQRQDRTKVGTISIFGATKRFDIKSSIPLLTTKDLPWKNCIEELLWFMRGDTDAKILDSKGVKIWNANTSKEVISALGLPYSEGVLGPGYGWQWRFSGAEYDEKYADTSKFDKGEIKGGFDQLEYVISELKHNPFSRRIIINAWNPKDLDSMVLQPCHYSVQFYVKVINGEKYLSCHYNMRSNDLFLGCPWNIFSYAVMTYIIALKVGMKPYELVYTGGDVHVYSNHVTQMVHQKSLVPTSSPKLILNPEIATKNIEDITVDDFELIGYFPHKKIFGKMAV